VFLPKIVISGGSDRGMRVDVDVDVDVDDVLPLSAMTPVCRYLFRYSSQKVLGIVEW